MKSLVEKIRNMGYGTITALTLGGLIAFTEPVLSETKKLEVKNKTELTIIETNLITSNLENSIMLEEVIVYGQKPDTFTPKKYNLKYAKLENNNKEIILEKENKEKSNYHKMMHNKNSEHKLYCGTKQQQRHGRMMHQRNQMHKEQNHKPGYIVMQKGEYSVGKIETPKETIIYRIKTNELQNNTEKGKLVKDAMELIKQYNLMKYPIENMKLDIRDKEKGKAEYRISLEEFKNGIRHLDKDSKGIEKRLEPVEKIKSMEMNHNKMAEHFKQYDRDINNKARGWENYAKNHKDIKDFRNRQEINRGHNYMNKCGKENLNKLQNNTPRYMQKNVEKKIFTKGEFYIRIQKNDSLENMFPMRPNFPKHPVEHRQYHK